MQRRLRRLFHRRHHPHESLLLMNRVLFTLLILSQACSSRADDDITIHSKIQLQDFRSPGRVVPLHGGRFACVSKGRYLVSIDRGRNWDLQTEIPAGIGPKVDGGLLVEDADGRLLLVYRNDAGMKLQRTPDNKPLPGAELQIWCVRSSDGGKSWGGHHKLIWV